MDEFNKENYNGNFEENSVNGFEGDSQNSFVSDERGETSMNYNEEPQNIDNNENVAQDINGQYREYNNNEDFNNNVTDNANDTTIPDANTADTTDNKKQKKKIHYNYRKSIAVGLAGTLLCGASMGFFFGVGVNTSKKIFNTANKFSFGATQDIVTNNEADTDGISATGGSMVTENDDITKTVNNVKNSIVNINMKAQTQNFFYQTTESEGSGSGIIYAQDDEKVYIVTNNHVVEDATTVTISISGEENINANLVGKDASSDLAVISVLKSDLKAAGIDSVTPAVFGDSDSMQVGESVIAIGNAMGQGKSATLGIVSAQDKEINIDGKTLKVIQTDAAINPGNSGGALVNMSGEVIGINTAKLSSNAVEGTGYAIPTNVAKDVIQTLVENGTVEKPYLGIQGSSITDQIKSMYNIPYSGVLVVYIEQGSAAEKAGLQTYDIITAIDGTSVTTIEELSEQIAKHKVGDSVTLSVVRNGSSQTTVTAVLGNLNSQF
jgi:serine protease Do